MASKRGLRRKQCSGKARHATAEHAAIARRRTGAAGHLSVYRCTHCGSYHVGHTPGKNGLGSGYGVRL